MSLSLSAVFPNFSYLTKRKQRIKVAKKMAQIESQTGKLTPWVKVEDRSQKKKTIKVQERRPLPQDIPHPFKSTGRLVHIASTVDEIPREPDGYNLIVSDEEKQKLVTERKWTLPSRKLEHELKVNCSAPEVAVIGRSNVGKSTLLNSLVGFNDSYVQKSPVDDKPGTDPFFLIYIYIYI